MQKDAGDSQLWSHLSNSPRKNAWAGIAFERVCLLHIEQIKKALGISGVQAEVHSLFCKADEEQGIEGSQIDLLIVRKDGVINLCEMKYSQKEYSVSKSVREDLLRKLHDLQTVTHTKSAIHLTLIVSCGLRPNIYSDTLQNVVSGSALFERA